MAMFNSYVKLPEGSHLEFSIHPTSKHSLLDIQPQASGLLDSVVGVFLGALARLTLILGSRDVQSQDPNLKTQTLPSGKLT